MNIRKLQKNWNDLGKIDPLWAILSDPFKKDNKWDVDEFFQTGEKEIQQLMEDIKNINTGNLYRRALDFGCGVGRLSNALAVYYQNVTGVDIAPSMIASAIQYNRNPEKCKFILNETDDLRAFSDNSFDFIYSNITLQHIRPVYIEKYLREFIRIIAPRGLIVFQLPSEPALKPKGYSIKKYIRSVLPANILDIYHVMRYRNIKKEDLPSRRTEMHGIGRERVIKIIMKNNAEIIKSVPDDYAGPEWKGYRYYVTKTNL